MLVGSSIWAFVKPIVSSPAGKYLLVLVAFIAWTGYQRQDAARDAIDALTAEIQEATSAEYERRVAVSQNLAREARDRASELEVWANQLELERDDIIQQIRAVPGGDCPIPDDVRERLRSIGNQ